MRWTCSVGTHSTSLSAAGFSTLLRPARPEGGASDPLLGEYRRYYGNTPGLDGGRGRSCRAPSRPASGNLASRTHVWVLACADLQELRAGARRTRCIGSHAEAVRSVVSSALPRIRNRQAG